LLTLITTMRAFSIGQGSNEMLGEAIGKLLICLLLMRKWGKATKALT
jgi:hypothetical protein